MKKRIIVGVTLILLSVVTGFSNFVLSGAVIGHQRNKWMLPIVLFVLGILLILDERLEKKILQDTIPKGTFPMSIGFSWGGYRFSAYPGPEVVGKFRAEHFPYHCHIERHGKTAYKVRVEKGEIQEMTGKILPPNLKQYIKENSKEIERKIKKVFHEGKLRN